MATTYVQIITTLVVMATVITLTIALPPFELRSRNFKSEGSEDWLKHLQKSRACQMFTENHPTFLCSSTKFSSNPECIHDSQVCDGTRNCPRGEDETPLLCSALRLVVQKEENDIWQS